jgi:hypothetical protein
MFPFIKHSTQPFEIDVVGLFAAAYQVFVRVLTKLLTTGIKIAALAPHRLAAYIVRMLNIDLRHVSVAI